MDEQKIAGVVLAGGRSSRMGEDKALLNYNGRSLLDHMIGILNKTGLRNIYVSGNFEGYSCIPDSAPHEGPAQAISDVLVELKDYDGVLFVPIDMPLLRIDLLHLLLNQKSGAYFTGFPLPAFIVTSCVRDCSKSVKSLLIDMDIPSITLPSDLEICMTNTNTPDEWQEVLRV